MWHVLDARSIWIKEFAFALNATEATVAWVPKFSRFGLFQKESKEVDLSDPPLRVREFPLQRGYARAPLTWVGDLGGRRVSDLRRYSFDKEPALLVCTTPYYAPVAERWPEPAVYYLTDLTVRYAGVNPVQVRALDRRMCRVAAAVCPNSQRIADYLVAEAGCDPEKITVVPNAARAHSLLPAPLFNPAPLPDEVADLPRPVAGIIGNMAGNLNWHLLETVVRRTPWLSWLFIGPVDMPMEDPAERTIRARMSRMGGRVRFTGARPYGSLRDYARAFDVAILPYRKAEPTFSGSSTRFYEHLAATRPILATRGFEELLHKEPLLRLTDTAEEMTAALEELNRSNFSDGLETLRWTASQDETWDSRAHLVRKAIGMCAAHRN